MKVYSISAAIVALTAAGVVGCGSSDSGAMTGDGDSGIAGDTGAQVHRDGSSASDGSGGGGGADGSGGGADGSGSGADGSGGGGGGGGTDAGTLDDGSSTDASNNDGGVFPFPAFPVDTATVMNNGGAVQALPKIVTITWSDDVAADVARYEAFGDSIGASNYWHAINSEYGVGRAVGGTHIHIPGPAPAAITDQQLDDLVSKNAGVTAGWPAPTPNTLYAVYMSPTTTSFMLGGSEACGSGVGGYHTETTQGDAGLSAADGIVYAIMPHCGMFKADDLIVSASHEFDEAVTDPLPDFKQAYARFDANHLSFELWNSFQDEVGDACESYGSSYFLSSEPAFAYPVQRQWSNAAAIAGHNACVPAADEGPYFNVTVFPADEDTINANLTPLDPMAPAAVPTKGYKVVLNTPRTFDVGYFSDADTGGPWTLTATVAPNLPVTDANGANIANGAATVTIDKPTGQNGDKAKITVTATSMSSTGVLFLLLTSVGTAPANDAGPTPKHYMPILIGTK